MKKNFDCIVIGYGPVGALLSIFLSKLGLSVAVIDKNLDVYPLPRAIHFDEEVMRIFQMVNLSKQISNISRIGTKGKAYYLLIVYKMTNFTSCIPEGKCT